MQSLITIIAALTIGLAGGWSYGNQSTQQTTAGQIKNTNPNDLMVAEDFVSLRPSLAAIPSESLSETELSGLQFMREEEKLARNVYSTLYEKWGLPIFSNIAQSEQTHTEAVRDLLEKYNQPDPVIDDTVGVFVNTDLQKLYTDLTSRGLTSVAAALQVGAQIEELDIRDLATEIAKTDNQDILFVYENLSRGSRNHLRSFISQLSSRDESYTPQYITQEEFDTIISDTQERGETNSSTDPHPRSGRGWGNR
jgi:hypothetical protein